MKQRTEEVSRVRAITSGGDAAVQFAAEVKSLSKEEWPELFQHAQLPVVIPMEHALAMKSNLGLSWNKLRSLGGI